MKKKLEQLLRALLADPDNPELLQKIATLYQRLGDDVRAAEHFERLSAAYARDGYMLKSIALSKQVLKLHPDIIGVRERLMALYAELGLDAEARQMEDEIRARAQSVDELRRLDALIAKLRPLAGS